MTLEQLQNKLSVEKWIASEQAGKDLCGDYAFCSKCDKAIEYPCARAYNKNAKAASGTAKKTTKKSK